MADEYQWLDQEAAERLLRGEPVDPVGTPARAQAELLARALDSARTPAAGPLAGPDGELPGEAAALAAFRKAVAERATA
ncbi:extensin, partial [Streptomyces sp. NPDC004787]